MSFLAVGDTPWELRNVIYGWLEPRESIDPQDVMVLSCDVIWDPKEIAMCDTPEKHEEDDFDDYYGEHRYCGTSGADRADYVAEMVSCNEEHLDGLDSYSASYQMSWVVSNLLGVEDAYPGTDYFNVKFGNYPVWEASLYGGVLLSKEAS